MQRILALHRAGFALAVAAVALVGIPGAGHAYTVLIGSDIEGTVSLTGAQLGCYGYGDITQCDSTPGVPITGATWSLNSWSMTLDPDPFVLSNISLTNPTGVTQNYIFTIVLPVAPPFGPPIQIQGSVGVTVTNALGTATAATIAPNALYRATIDGAVVRTLLNHPTTIGVLNPFGTNTVSANYGIPVLEAAGGAVASNIGIRLRFSLTPGDQIGITSVFNVVPEPSTALLVGVGLLGLVAAVRRHRA